MLSSQNLIVSPFLPMSLKFLIHPFMVDLVPECRRLIYALGIRGTGCYVVTPSAISF